MNETLAVDVSKVPVIAGISITTVKLIEVMKVGKIGNVLTDAQLTAACGKDTGVTGDGYANLQSAIRYVRRNHSLVWERVYKEHCIKCLGSFEIVGSTRRTQRKIHKASGVAIGKLKVADPNALDDEKRKEYFAQIAQFGTLRQFSSVSTTKALESQPSMSMEEIRKRQHKMLDAFK